MSKLDRAIEDVWGIRIEGQFLKALDSLEQEFERRMAAMFDRQADSMQQALSSGSKLLDVDRWNREFIEEGRPLIEQTLEEGALRHAVSLGLAIAFVVELPSIRRWVDRRVAFWADSVNQKTADQVARIVQRSASNPDKIAERLEDLRIANMTGRAKTIGRTEAVTAMGEGHLQLYVQAGARFKQWWTTLDERTRPAHRKAHLQVRLIDADFDVGGEKLRAPGQGGSPGNVINCRCLPLPLWKG